MAQQSSNSVLLKQKYEFCQSTLSNLSGKPETMGLLIKEARAGLALSTEKDHKEKLLFHQALGMTYYFQQLFDSAKVHFEAAYQQSLNDDLRDKGLVPLGNLISIYYYLGSKQEADSAAQKLKLALRTVTDKKTISDANYALGVYNQQQKLFYNIALEHFLKSAEMHRELMDTAKSEKLRNDYGVKLAMVAEIYLQLQQPEKAIQYLNEASGYRGNSAIISISAYGKYIRAYNMLNDKPNALKYYNLLHNTAAKTNGKWSELVSSNLQMFEMALREKNFTEAKKYLDKADQQAKKDGNTIVSSAVNLQLGEYYKATEDNAQALKYFQLAEAPSSAVSKEQYLELLKSIVAVEMNLGNTRQAQIYYQKLLSLSDSLINNKITSNIAEQEAVYQNKEKQRQIDVQNAQIAYSKKEKFWLFFGIIMLALATMMLVRNYRNKKRTADILDKNNKHLEQLNMQLEEANRTKAKLFGIISHDLRSPIYQVAQFLKIQDVEPDYYTKEQKKKLSDKIQAATNSLMQTLEDLLMWSKTQMKELNATSQKVNINKLVSESLKLMQLIIDEKQLRIANELRQEISIASDPYFLQTIIRNLLQNALRESLSGGLVLIGGDDKMIFIQNGGGYFSQAEFEKIIYAKDKDISLSGLGLKTVDELSKKINAKIEFAPTKDQTTKVCIHFL